MARLIISASYQTFLSICPAKSHLATQIYWMEITSLLKLVKVRTIFIHHHKHCIMVRMYIFSKYNSLPLWICVYTCPSVCTHVPVYVHMSQCMYTCPSVCTLVPVYVHMSQCMYTCPSVCTLVPVYVHMSQCMYTCPSVCTLVPVYVHMSQCMYTCPSVCTHVPVYVHMSQCMYTCHSEYEHVTHCISYAVNCTLKSEA